MISEIIYLYREEVTNRLEQLNTLMIGQQFLESTSFEEIQDHIEKLADIFERKIREFVDL